MAQYEKVYVSVDHADLSAERVPAEAVAQEVAHRLGAAFSSPVNMGITKHQLFKDGDAAFCFDINLPRGSVMRAAEISWEAVCEMCGEENEPGLCVISLPMEDDGMTEDVASHAERTRDSQIQEAHLDLIRFGQRARREEVTVQEALDTAGQFPQMILKGAGTGRRGIAGALAGAGLRIGGDDGTFTGEYDLTTFSSRAFGSVAQCIGGFRMQYGIDPVFADRSGGALGFHERIKLIKRVKPVLDGGRFTIVCALGSDDMWTPYTEEDFGKRPEQAASCDYFELDPEEEQRFRETKRRTCSTCLSRKLTNDGYICQAGHDPVRAGETD